MSAVNRTSSIKASPTAGDIAKKHEELEQKRLDALNDDSRKLGRSVSEAAGDNKTKTSSLGDFVNVIDHMREGGPKTRRGKNTSFRAAAETVLSEADGPMHSKDITAAVLSRKLSPTSGGKSPAQAMYVALHQGVERGIFVKVAPSTFDLVELHPRTGHNS